MATKPIRSNTTTNINVDSFLAGKTGAQLTAAFAELNNLESKAETKSSTASSINFNGDTYTIARNVTNAKVEYTYGGITFSTKAGLEAFVTQKTALEGQIATALAAATTLTNEKAALTTANTTLASEKAALTAQLATINNTTYATELDAFNAGKLARQAEIDAARPVIEPLTIGADTLVGTASNNVFDGSSTINTFSTFDSIDGGLGDDTLNVLLNATSLPSLTTVTGVETLNLNTTGAGLTANVSGFTGLTKANIQNSDTGDSDTGATDLIITAAAATQVNLVAVAAGGDITLTGGKNVIVSNAAADDMLITGVTGSVVVTAGAEATDIVSVNTSGSTVTSVTVLDGGIVAIGDGLTALADVIFDDDAVTDTLSTVSISGNLGVSTINSDALTSLSLADSGQNSTVTAAAGTRALGLTINKLTGGTIADATATSLNVTSTGSATTGVTVQAGAATAVTLTANAATTLAALTAGVAKTLAISGTAATTITANTLDAAVVITSTNTGGVTLTQALTNNQTFTGTNSSGADSIKVAATTKAITTGAGNDTVTINGSALGTGGSIDAGDGSADKIKFDSFANAAAATANATLAGVISGFEVLELDAANAADGATINLDNLDAISSVTYSATNTKDSVLSNLASNGSVTISADQTATEGLVINVKNAATGTADVLNVTLTKATALANVEVTAANVETVNITSTETATTLLGTVTHAATLSATSAKTLDIGGNAGVTLGTLTGATALTLIDASDVTTGLVSFTTDALASAATIKGGAGANTIVATAATKAVTYTGKDAVDNITINNTLNNNVSTAGGNDVIVTGAGNDTINAGAGDDTISAGAGLNVITTGTGADTVNLVVNSTGFIYSTITDAAAGDILRFTDNGTETFTTAKIELGAVAGFSDYLNQASSGNGGTNGNFAWFQFGGNTFIVQDNGAGSTFAAATDIVVQLSGLVDVSTATGVGTNALTLV